MKLRFAMFASSMLAAIAAVMGPGAGVAQACDTNWWNISCEFYSPSEGHSQTQFTGYPTIETVYASWSVYTYLEVFSSTAGGTWTNHYFIGNGVDGFRFDMSANSDKVGCFNYHDGTMFVNCRHVDSF